MNHSIITQSAFTALSKSDQDIWGHHREDVVREYCTWPDQYFNPAKYPEIAPYQLVIEDLPFHYPPSSHVRYHWRMVETEQGPHAEPLPEQPNANWLFMRKGFTYYLNTIVRNLAGGQISDAAKYLGVLLHVLQDTHELHALEGPWGIDLFALDRLMQWPEGDPYLSPTLLALKGQTNPIDLSTYHPRLEGTSIGETVLRLYRRYVQSTLANRRLHIPIVQARLAEDPSTAQVYLDQIGRTLAELSADVIHTVVALAMKHFDAEELTSLRQLPLNPMWAVQRPWIARGLYSFTPIVLNACLDRNRHRHPLQLRQKDGSIRQWERGWGSGAHYYMVLAYEIPGDVYQRLTTQIGLHESLGQNGCVDVQVLYQNQLILEKRLQNKSPILDVDLHIDRGGEVRFILREVVGSDPSTNNLVWASPSLRKA